MNNSDQAFIEAYRERREVPEPQVRVMKLSEMTHVVGANSPIELSFKAPSNQVILNLPVESPRTGSLLPMNRKHAQHRAKPAPHFAEPEASRGADASSKDNMIITNSAQAAPSVAEQDRAIQNAIAAGNELAIQAKIGNDRLAQLLSQNQKRTSSNYETETRVNTQVVTGVETPTKTEVQVETEAEADAKVAANSVMESAPAAAPVPPAEQESSPVVEAAAPDQLAKANASVTSPEVSEPDESASAATIAASADAVIEPAAKPELNPMWEVDSFIWPDVCNHIQDAGAEVLPDLDWVFACQPNMLAIGSVSRQGGATTAAICLARHIAAEGKNVLVIDANFESPSVAEQLGVRAPCCWRDKLIEDQSLGEASITSIEDRMTLMPLFAGDPPPAKFADAIREAIVLNAAAYDLAIVDIGVIDNARDSSLWNASELFGGLLVVRDLRHDGEAALASAIDAAEQCGTENVAVVENFTE